MKIKSTQRSWGTGTFCQFHQFTWNGFQYLEAALIYNWKSDIAAVGEKQQKIGLFFFILKKLTEPMLRLAENMYVKHCNIVDLFAGGALQTKLQNKQSIIYPMSHIKNIFWSEI